MDTLSYALGKKAGGGGAVLQSKSIEITSNGETTVNPDDGYNGLSSVGITANVQPDLESKSLTISTNTTTTITPTSGKDGLSSVEVTTNVPSGVIIDGTLQNKQIISGSVSKGDFVNSNISVNSQVDSSSEYYTSGSGSVVNDPSNMWDGNDNTYAFVHGNGSYKSANIVLWNKPYTSLNIPSDAEIVDIIYEIKIKLDSTDPTYFDSMYGSYLTGMRNQNWTCGKVFNDTMGNLNQQPLQAVSSDIVNEKIFTVSVKNGFGLSIGKAEYIGKYGLYIGIRLTQYSNAPGIDIYYCKYTVIYKDNGKIKKVTSSEESIDGIANGNGTAGDTIQVYVPNTSA